MSAIAVLKLIQSVHNPVLDAIFIAFTTTGSDIFFLFTLPVIYWCVNKRFGLRLTMLMLSSAFLNLGLKDLYHTPRPSPVDVRVLKAAAASGWAFPSGHAQATTTFWGYLAATLRRRWLTGLAIFLMVMVALSRLYLGVHWPVDVLGGTAIGGALVFGARWFFDVADEPWSGMNWGPQALAAAGIPLLVLAVWHDQNQVRIACGLAGFLVGSVVEEEFVGFHEWGGLVQQAAKILVGLVALMLIESGLKAALPATTLTDGLRYAAMGNWVSLGAPCLFAAFWPETAGDNR